MLWEVNSNLKSLNFNIKRKKFWVKTNNGKSWVEMGVKAEVMSESIDIYNIGSILPMNIKKKIVGKVL